MDSSANHHSQAEHDPDETIERWLRKSPESKLELIDGRLIAGNSLSGSRYCSGIS